MSKRPEPPPVHARIAGKVEVSTIELRRRLSKTAFNTWVGFLWRRNADGLSWARLSAVADARGLSERQVKRALTRLRACGLVVPTGELWERRIPVRRVLGDYRGGQVYLPRKVWNETRNLRSHGGPRPNAGRPRTEPGLEEEPPVKSSRPPYSGESSRAGPESSRSAPAVIQTGPHKIEGKTEEEERSSSPTERKIYADESAGVLISREEGRAVLRGPAVTGDYYVPSHRGVRNLVPPYPDNVTLHAPRLRSPPPLEERMDEEQRVRRLLQAYRGAVQRTYDVDRPVLSGRGAARRSALWPKLIRAAEVLVKHRIPPIAWACWCVERWAAGDDPKLTRKPPALGWVFGPGHIEKRRGWYGREEAAFLGGRVFPSEPQLEYRRAYKLMCVYLRDVAPDADSSEVRSAVRRAFPMDGGWKGLLREVLVENAEQQAALDGAVRRGEWLF